jgi:metal-responsive CopG/Arc/MetJ family transcriptional regulator
MARKTSTMMGVSLDKGVFTEFQRVCEEKCINRSMLVNKLIVEWLQQNDDPKASRKKIRMAE